MDIFVGISLTIVIATVIAGILQRLKQPIIIGHIITGLIVGPYLFNNSSFIDIFDLLSKLGIALLLFIIGLNLTPKVIKEVGRVSLLTGLGQIIITSIAGFAISFFVLHFDKITSIYLGLGLTFSSTIIIMKLLSDKKELSKFYSKISIGLLLVQDFLVALILIGISAFSGGDATASTITLTVLKGIVLIDLIVLATIYVLPLLSSSFAKSQEFLFLFSIGWGLGLATLFHHLGFSMEIGALIAGVTLSTSPYHFEISSRLKPLRDFFIILFFILLGTRIKISTLHEIIYPALFLSAFVVILKPILVMLITGILGYRKKVNFLTSINFTQVSEFSLILLVLGQQVSGIGDNIISLITLISLITIAISSYIVLYGGKIFPIVQHLVFERKNAKVGHTATDAFEVVLFGCDRMGTDFIDVFKELGKNFIVVDYDPEKIKELDEMKIKCRYGDADDNEFLEELNLTKAKMIISTIPDFETNQFLINKIRSETEDVVVMVISHDADEAIGLYQAGATYVITPHFLGGKYASMLISKYGFDVTKFLTEKEKHIKDLEKRKAIGKSIALPELYR
jgi:Kef-type K+ transport system membrane component KefB/Trk K+ transport system NAD-binding subunit